jgi:ech hydrogenase subunit A
LSTIVFLILFPLIAALILLFIKSDSARRPVVIVSSILIGLFSILLVAENYGNGLTHYWPLAEEAVGLIGLGFGEMKLFSIGFSGEASSEMMSYLMMGIEVIIALVIIFLGIKYKKYLASILAAIQAPVLVWFELNVAHDIEVANNMYVDDFSMIMVLIIGIIGTLICVYAVPYMKDFESHHPGAKDRRPWFFFLLFVFLSAMFGIVLSNNIMWMFFFWEITTLCSFFLIGYTKTPEAIRNSFRAIIMNLLGGVAFLAGIVFLGLTYKTLEFDAFLEMGANVAQMGSQDPVIALIVSLFAFAGLTKAAQMPFNSWLLGAMVAPTPTSALLHSSTMVKAGVFMLVKLSPLLGVSSIIDIGPGFMVVTVGGVTFLLASLAAITQSNAKRVLAYSTIANLGLIAACAGIGTPEGVWAATLLIIFHAVTKSLLFLSVGTAEHNIGSRDIESMDGLFGRLPRLATFMIIGIAAMFLAPFGMLVSKWAALQSFVDSSNVWVILCICFGSAVTLFYWGKWLGKLIAVVPEEENIQNQVHGSEWFVLGGHVALVVLVSLTFPLISDAMVLPYMNQVFKGMGEEVSAALASDNMVILVILVAVILILPLMFYGKTKKRVVDIYMAGVNKGNNLTYNGSMDIEQTATLRNWYMEGMIGEKRMNKYGIIVTCTVFALTFSYMLVLSLQIIQVLQTNGGVM